MAKWAFRATCGGCHLPATHCDCRGFDEYWSTAADVRLRAAGLTWDRLAAWLRDSFNLNFNPLPIVRRLLQAPVRWGIYDPQTCYDWQGLLVLASQEGEVVDFVKLEWHW